MAHSGSSFAILSNCGCASSYQKSCSNATPRLKGARTDGEQDTEKDTLPKRSTGGAACAAIGRAVSATRKGVNIFIGLDYRTVKTPSGIGATAARTGTSSAIPASFYPRIRLTN